MNLVVSFVGFFVVSGFIQSDVYSVPYHDQLNGNTDSDYILQVTIYDEDNNSIYVYETSIDTSQTVQAVYNSISTVVQKYYPNENVILEHDGIPITDPEAPFYDVASNYEVNDNYGRVGVKPSSKNSQLWSANHQTNNVNNAVNAPNTVINKETNIKRKHSERIRIHESSSSETIEEFVIPASSSSSEVSSPSSSTEESSSSYSSSSSSSSSSYSSSSSSSYSSLSSMSSGYYEFPVCHDECTVTESTTTACTFTTDCEPALGPATTAATTGCPASNDPCFTPLQQACSTPGTAPVDNSGVPSPCSTLKGCAGTTTTPGGTPLVAGTSFDCSKCFPDPDEFPCPSE